MGSNFLLSVVRRWDGEREQIGMGRREQMGMEKEESYFSGEEKKETNITKSLFWYGDEERAVGCIEMGWHGFDYTQTMGPTALVYLQYCHQNSYLIM